MMTTNESAGSASTADKTAQASQGTADIKQPSLEDLVPAVTDAPKGEVALGEKAGAFGPWRAHQVIDEIAKKIAGRAGELVRVSGVPAPRVLVVDDLLLLPGDWTAHYVRSTLDRMKDRLATAESQLDRHQQRLAEAIERLEQEEAQQPARPQLPSVGRRRGIDQGAAAGATESAAATPNVPSGALGAAVNLLGLLRTDYTITATAVSATPSELSTLTAAHLARPPVTGEGEPPAAVPVEANAFATTGLSPTAGLFKEVLDLRDTAIQKLSDLQASLAPVQAELAAINARTASVEQAWATAMADKKDGADITLLQTTLDGLAEQSARREKAVGPTAAVVAYGQQVVTDVDAAVAALLKASGTGEAPLFTAVRYERLEQAVDSRKITHVLYVNLDAVAADAVTRRSILGTSGRIRFLSASNASWLLLNTAESVITGGGQENLADVMTFSLETGNAQFEAAGGLSSSEIGDDPLDKLENWAKGFVAVFAIVLFALGVLSVIAIVKIALGK